MAITWNPVYYMGGATFSGLSNGDLTFTNTGQANPLAIATVGKKTGKWYWEYTTGNTATANYNVGIAVGFDLRQSTTPYITKGLYWRGDKAIFQDGTQRYSAATVNVAPGNGTVGIAVDCDTGKVWFAKNNSWVMSGDPANGTNPVADPTAHSWWNLTPNLLFPAVNGYVGTTGVFASGSLTYSPPSGFSALTDATDWEGNIAYCHLRTGISVSELAGKFQISGTVDRLGSPGPYLVCLFDRATQQIIRKTWSDDDGAYLFGYLSYIPNGYFIVAYDNNATPLNAAISDLITPELMP